MIVIASVPYVDTTEPIMAPGLLKGVLSAHGIESTAIDLNIEIVNQIENHPHKQKILDFFFSQIIHPEVIDDIVEIINYCVDRITKDQPTVIALSLLVYSCQIFTAWLSAAIKQKMPDVRIVIGGTGIKNFIADTTASFCDDARQLRLIDDYISGDGDISFHEYIKGNYTYPGINTLSWQPIPDLNNVPYPDYSDYDFSQYDKMFIPICDSRGCVKNCEFCDNIEFWKKFQFRSADSIFNEMLLQMSRYNITHFSFRNSLTNGNLKEFKKLLDLMANYNETTSNPISWEGYFIIRSPSQHPEIMWEKISKSNGMLKLGVESVVSRVRHQMGKTFENSEIDFHLEMGQKYKVPLVLLMIVAYPTENLADYEYTKQWFKERAKYANNSVASINLSFASILPNTALSRKVGEYNLVTGSLPSIWINQQLNITSNQRKEYLQTLEKICAVNCNFNTHTNEQTLEHTDELH